MNNLLTIEIVGNELWRIISLFGFIFIAFLLGRIARFGLAKWAEKYERMERTVLSTAIQSAAKSIVFLLVAFGISLGLHFLEMHPKVQELMQTLSRIIITLSIGYLIYLLIDVPVEWMSRTYKDPENSAKNILLPVVRKSLRVTVVILILVQVAQIMSDKPITSIIAGLGIGGLAVALAAQDSIKNFFGSIILSVDKPFVMGDRIVVDSHDGPVEEVGLRSTKIRTLDGHLVTIPNGELANKTIRNISKRPYIRRLLNITITYDTPAQKIDQAVKIIKEILNNHEGMHEDFPPRVTFNEFNSDSLNLMVIYWYHPPDYWAYMDFSEKFNKTILQRFNEEGIDFAFPTQTLFLAGDTSRPLNIGLKNTDT